MKKIILFLPVFLISIFMFFTGCDLAVDIFKTGIWVGGIIVFIMVSAVLWLFTKK